MKYLLMGIMTVLIWTGCATSDQGGPGDDSYVETPEQRRNYDKVGNNMSDVGRQGSPTSPFTGGNGSLNF